MTFNTAIIEKGLNATFQKAYTDVLKRPYLKDVSELMTMAPSTSYSETYAWLGDIPSVKEWVGDKSLKGLNDYKYTILNKDWYSGFSIHKNELDDDQLPAITPRVADLAHTVAQFPYKLIIELINNGESDNAYDGNPFFDSSNRSFSNLLTGTGITTSAIESDISTARAAMMKFTSDQGEILGLRMDTVVCAPEMEATFLEACVSVAGEETFRPAARWIKRVICIPELSETSSWYGFATDRSLKPFIYQDRKKVSPVLDDTEMKKNGKLAYSAELRGNAGYGFPHMAIKVTNS